MLGRATRLCPEIGGPGIDKESFRVFDAVRQSDAIGDLTEMKPVVVNPSLSFRATAGRAGAGDRPGAARHGAGPVAGPLAPARRPALAAGAEQFTAAAGETPAETLARVRTADPADLAAWVAARPGLGPILDWQPDAGRPVPLAVSFHPDAHVATTVGYGAAGRPEDYLAAFGAFLRDQGEQAGRTVPGAAPPARPHAGRPAGTGAGAAGGRVLRDGATLRLAGGSRQEDVAAKLIGFVRQAALGDALEPWAVRVQRAVEAVIRRGGLTPDQQRWLRRIGTQVAEIGVADPAALDQGQFREAAGGFTRLDRVFGGRLAGLLGDINEAAWKDSGMSESRAVRRCNPRHRPEAVASVRHPARRRHHLPGLRHRADLPAVPQDAGRDAARGGAAGRCALGQPDQPAGRGAADALPRAAAAPRHRGHGHRPHHLHRRPDQPAQAHQPARAGHPDRPAGLVFGQGGGPGRPLRGPAGEERRREEVRRRAILHPAPADRLHGPPAAAASGRGGAGPGGRHRRLPGRRRPRHQGPHRRPLRAQDRRRAPLPARGGVPRAGAGAGHAPAAADEPDAARHRRRPGARRRRHGAGRRGAWVRPT